MDPLDLTKQAPRSPYIQLGGLVMLARTIDKLRAELPGGNLGEYHFSGFSTTLAEALKLEHEQLLEIVAQAKSEDEVVTWILEHTDQSVYPSVNEELLGRSLNESNRERLEKKYPVILEHPEVVKLFDVIMLDDAAHFAKQIA